MPKANTFLISSIIIILSSNFLSVLCEYQCVKAQKDQEVLKLKRNYDFRPNTSYSSWDIIDESYGNSTGNGINSINYNSKHNVRLVDDYMVLFARQESTKRVNFSGATITSGSLYKHGRWEIRARLPEGAYLRTAIFANRFDADNWLTNGQLDLLVYNPNQTNLLARGVHFANNSGPYQPADFGNFRNREDFHTFGIEWDSNGVQFFVDQEYSSEITFQNRKLSRMFELRLQVAVGGIGITLPEENVLLKKLDWNCPALIVDYVRIYEPYSNSVPYAEDEEKEKCLAERIDKTPRSAERERKAVNEICWDYKSAKKQASYKADISIILSIFGAVFIVVVSLWMVRQIRSIKRKLDKSPEYGTGNGNMIQNMQVLDSYNTSAHVYDRSDSGEQYYEILDEENRTGSGPQTPGDPFYLPMLPTGNECRS